MNPEFYVDARTMGVQSLGLFGSWDKFELILTNMQ